MENLEHREPGARWRLPEALPVPPENGRLAELYRLTLALLCR